LRRKPITTFNNLEFDTSTEDLQNRIRKLKETVRKTKESLTANTLKTTQKRKRVKGKKRLRRPNKNRLTNENPKVTIVYPENTASNLPTFSRHKLSGETSKENTPTRSRTRGRGRIVVKHRVNSVRQPSETKTLPERNRSRGRPSHVPVQEIFNVVEGKKTKNIEQELEDKYGKDVVGSLLGVLVKAVSHPDKDRILNQLKGQLASMNIDDVKRLQFGVDDNTVSTLPGNTDEKSLNEGVTSDRVNSGRIKVTTNTPTDNDNITPVLENVFELQLKRVEDLAKRFKSRKPIFINSEIQSIRSKESRRGNKNLAKQLTRVISGPNVPKKIVYNSEKTRTFQKTSKLKVERKPIFKFPNLDNVKSEADTEPQLKRRKKVKNTLNEIIQPALLIESTTASQISSENLIFIPTNAPTTLIRESLTSTPSEQTTSTSIRTTSELPTTTSSMTEIPTTTIQIKSANLKIDGIRNRIQKIKMVATTDRSIIENDPFQIMMDGLPNGEPGLTKGFFERVPFLPSGMKVPTRIPSRIASISESDLPAAQDSDLLREPNIVESLSAIRKKLSDLRESTAGSNEIQGRPLKSEMSHEIPIAKSTEDDIKQILDDQDFDTLMKEAMETEIDIQKTHKNPKTTNMILAAHNIESAIQTDHEKLPLETLIPEIDDKQSGKEIVTIPANHDISESIFESNILSMNINKTMSENLKEEIVDNQVVAVTETTTEVYKPTKEPSLNLFNSTDLVFHQTKFLRVNKTEQDKTSEEESLVLSQTKVSMPSVKPKSGGFSPTALPFKIDTHKSKHRRRKLFRKHSKKISTSKPTVGETTTSEKPTFRPLKRKLKKPTPSLEVNEITIEEKSNPRKIIFRKGLTNTNRRRVMHRKKKDPLVESLLNQIKKQKSKLFRKKPKNKARKGQVSVESVETSPSKNEEQGSTESTKTTVEEENNQMIDEMDAIEIMRQSKVSITSTPVSTASDSEVLQSADKTTTIKDSTTVTGVDTLTKLPVNNIRTSTTAPESRTYMVKSELDTGSTEQADIEMTTIPTDSIGEATIHTEIDEKDNEIVTESPDMYETSTVIATSISTSEAIVYFKSDNV